MARQLDALGVDIIEAGFPIASEADAEAVRRVSMAVERPVVAALARCAMGDVERAGRGARAREARPHPHVHRDVRPASGAQAAHDARGVPRRGRRGGDEGAVVHARRRVFGRGRDAQRSRLSLPRDRGGDRRRRDDDQPAGHGRLFDAGRDRRVLPQHHRPRAERGSRDLQRALPRRPGPGGREHAGGDRRRRAAGRVHDQRHRRARRQRVARRDRDGQPRPRRIACRSRPASTRSSCLPRASC